MGAGHLIGGGVRHIDPLIQVLQIGQVHGEQALDDPGIDIGQGTQLGDDPGEQDDGKIAGVLLHLGVPHGQYLIRRRGQPHHAFAVQIPVGVHITLWQFKFKFRLHGLPPSCRAGPGGRRRGQSPRLCGAHRARKVIGY